MDSLTLTEAKHKRAHIRASATRLKTFIESFNISQGSRHDINERKQRLADLWIQFDAVQSRIETLENANPENVDKDALLEQQVQQRASFENPYYYLMSRYDAILEHYSQPEIHASPQSENNRTVNSRETRIRLPKIVLPVFTGAYEDWYSYQDTFEKLIHLNGGLTELEKFYYLRSSLKDKAAEVIKSIETTTNNYYDAWTAIKERFDNKRWIIQRHIEAIFDVTALNKENHTALLTRSLYSSNISFRERDTAALYENGMALNIDYEQLLEAQKNVNVLIVDVREPSEIQETGKLPGSVHIPMNDISNEFVNLSEEEFEKKYSKRKPTKNTKIIFSCRSGRRSGSVQETMQKLGYTQAYNYTGGWLDWEKHTQK